jgi:hypothetical protein
MSDANQKTRRGLPATIFVRRDRDRVSGDECFTAGDTVDTFSDRDVVGIYRRVEIKTLRVTRRLQ